MIKDLGAVILAGHNTKVRSAKREGFDKLLGSIYGDPYIHMQKNKSLLRFQKLEIKSKKSILKELSLKIFNYLPYKCGFKEKDAVSAKELIYNILGYNEFSEDPNASTNLERVIENVKSMESIDNDFILPVGPKHDIREKVGIEAVDQGDSIGENASKCANALYNAGYNKDWLFVTCGDTPLSKGRYLDEFVDKCLNKYEGDADLFLGVCSRKQLRAFINTNKKFVEYGWVRINFPLPRALNKFGIGLIDDKKMFYDDKTFDFLVSGNTFMVHRKLINNENAANEIYDYKRMFANIANLRALIREFGLKNIYKCFVRRKLTVSEAEKMVSSALGLNFKLVEMHPVCALDLDTGKDMQRASAISNSEEYHNL